MVKRRMDTFFTKSPPKYSPSKLHHPIIQPLALTCTSSTWPVILSRMPWITPRNQFRGSKDSSKWPTKLKTQPKNADQNRTWKNSPVQKQEIKEILCQLLQLVHSQSFYDSTWECRLEETIEGGDHPSASARGVLPLWDPLWLLALLHNMAMIQKS